MCIFCFFFFFEQKTAYEMRISDWSSDVCSSDLESLQSGLDGMETKVAKATMGNIEEALAASARAVDAQYDKLYRKLDDFAKLTNGKGTIGGLTIERSEERRVGKECGSKGRSGWAT